MLVNSNKEKSMKHSKGHMLLYVGIAAFMTINSARAARWWTHPEEKARIPHPDGAMFDGPHYWNMDASGSLIFVTTGYDQKTSEFGYLYSVEDLVGAEGLTTNILPIAHGQNADLGPYSYGLRGGAISLDLGVVISGNAYEGNNNQFWGHAVLPATGAAWNRTDTNFPQNVFAVSNDVSVHVVWDSADFSHDSKYLYSNDYMWDIIPGETERIWKWNVGDLSVDGLGLTSNAVYSTSVEGIWSVNVYNINGRDLIYYGGIEFAGAETNIIVCVFDTVDEIETVLLRFPNTAETNPLYGKGYYFEVLQNVKVSGVGTDRMHLYITYDDGTIMIYGLKPGGKVIGPKLRHFTAQDICDILGVASLGNCRVFEVTNDERFAIFASHNQNRIHIIHSHPVETMLLLR